MMGCFSTSASRVEKQRSSSVPRSGPLRSVIASKDSLTLLANKPVELPDPGSIVRRFEDHVEPSRFGEDKTWKQILRGVDEGRTAFSGPMGKTVLPASYESSCEGVRSSRGMRTLRRTTSFGGRPQPLPLPVAEETLVSGKQQEAQQRSRRVRSFSLEETPGSRSARRGRVAPVGGMPLPPPSLAGKMFTAVDLVDGATTPRAADVQRARVRNFRHGERPGMAVFRLAQNAAHVR